MKNTFLTSLFSILNEHFSYAVLRNHEGLPDECSSRDIDLLVLKSDLPQIQAELARIAAENGCRMLYQFCDHQFWTVVYLDAELNSIQLDFQFNFAWMGIDLLDERMVLEKRIFNGKVWHLPIEWQFLPKYLYCRILGAKYPEKYRSIREAALQENEAEIQQVLSSLGGDLSYWDKAGKWRLRFLTFASRLLRNPARTIARMSSYLYHTVKALFVRRGLMVSFSGPDGCGKTTVINLLCEHLQVNPPILLHFRPTLFPNLGEAAHKAGVVKTVDRNFDQPHRAKKKGLLNSLIRLVYYSTDYVLGYWLKVMPLRQRKQIVFFDRYFTDIIVDSERSSIFLNYKFLAFLRHFIPKCQLNFIFRVDPERIRARKQELEVEDMQRIYTRLEYLAARDTRYAWIDNNGTPEEAVRQILENLSKDTQKH